MRKLTLSLAVMAALLPARGYPLGLGEIELNSALNQELNAEIEVLSASSEDAGQLIVQLASREAFNRAGIDRPYLLQQLKFKIVDKDGTPYVKVFTKSPIQEPFLSFLLEIDWPQGHLLREYTLLLDPPVYNTADTAGSVAEGGHPFIDPADAETGAQPETQQYRPAATPSGVAPPSQSATISSDSGRSVSYQAPAPAKTGYAPATSPSAPQQYRVKENDTLWSMANRMRPDSSVSVEQMMLALVRKNPEAFIQENINGVKRGYILRVPGRDEATQLDRQQAIAKAREHAALWREYSQYASSAAPASSMQAEASEAVDTTTDTVSKGHLSIVGASDMDGSETAGANQDPESELSRLKQELAYAREQLESEKIEKETLQSRLSDLEQKVQNVINMDDAQLAELQQSLGQAEDAPEMVDEATVEAVEPVAEEELAVDEVAVEEVLPEELAVDEMPAEPGVEDLTEEAVDALESEAVFVDEVDTTDADPAVDTEMTDTTSDTSLDMAEPADQIEPPAFAQQKPKSFIDSLTSDPKMLGIIGGGLAFILLLLALLLKRLRGKKDESSDALDDMGDLPDMDDAVPGAEDMDSTTEMMAASSAELGMEDTQIDVPAMDDDSLEDTVFSLNDADEPEQDEQKDDVLAEADVYLAYGIYQQAEDLLKNAIDQQPERDDYRMKLLETHYAAKNSTAFEQLAEDVKTRKGDDATYWGRVAAMGAELCPASALFTGAGDALADFDADSLLPEKPVTTDLELDAGESSAAETDLEADLGLGLDLGEPDDNGGLDDLEDVSATTEFDLETDLAGLQDGVDAPQEASSDDVSSDLEFDLGEMSADDAEGADDALSMDDATDDLDLDEEDFSLDFAASDLGFEEPEEESGETGSTAEELSTDSVSTESVSTEADLDLDADLDLGADLDEETEMDLTGEFEGLDLDADVEIETETESGSDDISLDLDDDLDLGMDLDETSGEIDDVADELDLDGELDLTEEASEGEISLDEMAGDDDFDISELSDDVDEVSTKLDLAKAYIDMGDKDGARSILEEVQAEGNDAQKQEAEALLQQAD